MKEYFGNFNTTDQKKSRKVWKLFSDKKSHGKTINLVRKNDQITANNFNFYFYRISKNYLLALKNKLVVTINWMYYKYDIHDTE